jgi:hypothetical protein
MSTNGYPAKIPPSSDSWIPLSTAGMYSLGIAPPVTLLTKLNDNKNDIYEEV